MRTASRSARRALTIMAVLCCWLQPSPARAWGSAAHRYIMGRAIDLLPRDLKPFFAQNRIEIVIRATDPDLWRNAGWPEDPNHFLDFGLPELGPYPFEALPRDYGSALEKFGDAALRRIGLLPWRAEEIFGNLRRGFANLAQQPYASHDVVLFSAVLGHYIQDAHQPLHATSNYDGQLTGNDGIHARFETDLFQRFETRLAVRPAPPKAIGNARDAAFSALLESYTLVDSILAADKDAAAGRTFYDDAYYEKLFSGVKPTLERRLAESITATAGLILGAWEAAGRPLVGVEQAAPLQRIKK